MSLNVDEVMRHLAEWTLAPADGGASLTVLCERYGAQSHCALRDDLAQSLATFCKPLCELAIADLDRCEGGLQLLDVAEHQSAAGQLNDALRKFGASQKYDVEHFERDAQIRYARIKVFGEASCKFVTFEAHPSCPRVIMLLLLLFF